MTPWREHIARGALTRVTLESNYERIRDGLRGMPIEVWHVPRGSELLVSDNAAFTFAYSDDKSHIRINMAFGDSHGAALPIARDCLIAVGPAAKDDQLLAGQVDLFNELAGPKRGRTRLLPAGQWSGEPGAASCGAS